ncbi:hypothetical protein BJY24_003242 [Nocardia transvalensis]|uniref:DUF2505 domain-containing protein n=1 Tax=Nocardia transvalensis TaxID=37333 RepID=A0A7W9PE51_9NOCA|nr:DUF2505 domain-containing protein [Nocardia transvalensis]MBB5914375.1 hypothetical protein [Nocardia transvalensis]
MATPLAYTAQYTHPADAIRAAFADEQYWKDRIEEVGGPNARLDSFRASVDEQQMQVEMVQSIPASELPSAITSVRPGDLIIPRTESYSGFAGTFTAQVQDAPAQVRGTVTLTDEGETSHAVIEGSVEVTVPLFGKKIEKVVAEKLLELLEAETDFTNTWISSR